MIIVFYGTTGELIKIAPFLRSVGTQNTITINTAQQPQQVKKLAELTEVGEADYTLTQGYKGEELAKIWQMALWFPKVAWSLLTNNSNIRKQAKADGKKPVVIVHGDTITTVIGALYGRLNGYTVAHIEAGLRSHDWRNPFPEELDRMVVSKLARMHFAPGDVPIHNLQVAGAKGLIVNTKLNTVLDSMMMARETPVSLESYNFPTEYGLVSIHRNELMAQPEVLKQLLMTLNEYAEKTALIFLDHPVTKARITELGYDNLFTSEKFIRVPKLSYYEFMSALANAQFVVTDSGGLQEESAYINMPCLLHRVATEREEGLGQNVVLSKFDDTVVRAFLENPAQHTGEIADKTQSPTAMIVTTLKDNGYIN